MFVESRCSRGATAISRIRADRTRLYRMVLALAREHCYDRCHLRVRRVRSSAASILGHCIFGTMDRLHSAQVPRIHVGRFDKRIRRWAFTAAP